MNDLGLSLEVVSRSSQPLRYIRRWISRKPLEIETSFQRTTNMKWHKYGLWNGHVTDDVMLPPKVLWGSMVGYPSDSLASCSMIHPCDERAIAYTRSIYAVARKNCWVVSCDCIAQHNIFKLLCCGWLLANRTNGRAIGTVLRLSVCRL